ncbi:hypothetical protein [Janthinobacterium sp. PSPC2-1]|uniref:hypothetical protein n=1 Tax=unclassified Janthinobacterium TaxID=2610881 RepID=UPI003CE6C6D9
MTVLKEGGGFRFSILMLLLIPYILLYCAAGKEDRLPLAAVTAAATCLLSLVAHLYRNRIAILEGIAGSLLLIGILMLCAFIPVVGWIADVLLILYALASVLAALQVLLPIAFKGALILVVFIAALAPEIHHPLFSPLAYGLFCLFLTAWLSRKSDPFSELLLLFASLPLLAIVIASLGKMFRSGFSVTRNVKVGQHVSGYTTQAGVNVADYTRMVTKSVTTATTSVNATAVAVNTAAGKAAERTDAE